MAELFIHPKEGRPFSIELAGKSMTIGRSAVSDLVLADTFCSGCHAMIYPSGESYAVQDSGSKNGTFLNGRRITTPVVLKPGDEILVGSTRIYFDRELKAQVEVVEKSISTGSLNTVIDVRDVIGKSRSVRPGVAADSGLAEAIRSSERKNNEILGEVSQALIYHLPLNKLMERIIDLLTGAIPMDRAVLMIRERLGEELKPMVVRVLNDALKAKNIEVSKTIINTVIKNNQAMLISDISSNEAFRNQASVVQAGIGSAVCVPLWNNESIVGVIYGDRMSFHDQFTEEDLRLLILLANLAAVKYENARLTEGAIEKARLEKELALAAHIQRNFLPAREPQFGSYDISGKAVTCTHVGGDYYDFIEINSGVIGLVIADVSGTGVSSALLMASLRAALRTESISVGNLASITARLNDFVHSSSQPGFFISFFLGILDGASGELVYVNAGHNPPSLVNPGREILRLGSTGLCLGMLHGTGFETGKEIIETGGLLCLYTDGIIEQRDARGEEYGYEKLGAFLQDNGGLAASELISSIIGDVYGFAGCQVPGDDMTVVVVKRL